MDLIRQWVLQIAGVIILNAICDAIMVDGDMKKYVKPVLGFVLVFAIIQPIYSLSADKIKIDILQDSVTETLELSQEFEEKQQIDIIRIYEQKLEEKIKSSINSKYNVETEIFVKAVSNEKDFGNIQQVHLIINVQSGKMVNIESIRRYIKEAFGVELNRIKVDIREG